MNGLCVIQRGATKTWYEKLKQSSSSCKQNDHTKYNIFAYAKFGVLDEREITNVAQREIWNIRPPWKFVENLGSMIDVNRKKEESRKESNDLNMPKAN